MYLMITDTGGYWLCEDFTAHPNALTLTFSQRGMEFFGGGEI